MLVGPVEVLHLRQRFSAVDGGGQLICQLALFVNGALHGLPALLQSPEVLEPLLQRSERGIVHGAVKLLAVAGDEGDGVALVQQAHHVFHVLRGLVQLLRQRLNDVHTLIPFKRAPLCGALFVFCLPVVEALCFVFRLTAHPDAQPLENL